MAKKPSTQQLMTMIQQLQGQLQAQNSFMQSPVGRQMRKSATEMVNHQKATLAQKQSRFDELKARQVTLNYNPTENGLTRIVSINGVPTAYTINEGKATNLRPITAETYKELSKGEQIQFDTTFKAESMAIKYGAFQPNLTQDYFNAVVPANGLDYRELELSLNAPKLEQHGLSGLDWHSEKASQIRSQYESYDSYLKGESLSLKQYRQENSMEGRRAVVEEMGRLGEEIQGLQTELGVNGSFVKTQLDGGGASE